MGRLIGLLAVASLWLGASVAEAAVSVPPPVDGSHIAFHEIDVEQGFAALVETPCGTIMIDAGGRKDAGDAHLLAYLRAYFAARPALNNKLAALFLTHPHKDHAFALLDVTSTYAIGGYVSNGQNHGTGAYWANELLKRVKQKGIPHVEVNEQLIPFSDKDGYTDSVVDPLACAGTDPVIRVLAGEKIGNSEHWIPEEWSDENNHSLVIRIDYGDASFLVMGDLEIPAQTLLISHYRNTPMLNVDVYQVAHHGSYNGTDDATVNALTPKIAVIGAGASNIRAAWTADAYGHPHCRAIKALLTGMAEPRARVIEPIAERPHQFTPRPIDKAIYSTGWDGDIVITADKDRHYSFVTSETNSLPAGQASNEALEDWCRNSSGGQAAPAPRHTRRRR